MELFFSNPANRVEANRLKFWQEITKDLAGNQTDCRGIVIEHMKREVVYENPDDNLAHFCYKHVTRALRNYYHA